MLICTWSPFASTEVPNNPPEEKSKPKSVPSSTLSNLKVLKRDIEMRKLMLKQEQEHPQYELEMQRQKL